MNHCRTSGPPLVRAGLLLMMLLVLGLGCRSRHLAHTEVTLMVAHAGVSLDDPADGVLSSGDSVLWAIGADTRVAPVGSRGSVRVGARYLQAQKVREELPGNQVQVPGGGGGFFGGSPGTPGPPDAKLNLDALHLTASYRHLFPLGEGGAFFLEPGLAVGQMKASVSHDRYVPFGQDPLFGPVVPARGADDQSWMAGPFLRAGWLFHRLRIGVETGYYFTGIEFDDQLGDNLQLWYVGGFISLRLGAAPR